MKKLILALAFLLPLGSSATSTIPWFQIAPSDTYIFPSTVNGIAQGILVNGASSTLQNFTGLNATTSSLFTKIASTTNLWGTSINGFGLSSCTGGSNALTWSVGRFGCQTIGSASGSKWATSTDPSFIQPNSATGIIVGLSTSTQATSTTLYVSGKTSLIGNTGVGTASPESRFHVLGTVNTIAIFQGSDATAYSPTGFVPSNYSNLRITNEDTSDNTVSLLSFNHRLSSVAQSAIASIQVSLNNSALAFLTEGSNSLDERMRITSTGNVGIGTTSPSSLLHIEGSSPTITVRNSGSSQTGTISFTNQNGTQGGVISVNQSTGEMRWGGSVANFFPTFYSNGSEAMRITTGGNVGIGTTSPYVKLAVDGQGVFNQDVRANFFTATGTDATMQSTLPYLIFTNATGTRATTTSSFSSTASSTNLWSTLISGAGLSTCNSASNALTWTGGRFGCNTISGGSTSGTLRFGGATSTISAANGSKIATSTLMYPGDTAYFWGHCNSNGSGFKIAAKPAGFATTSDQWPAIDVAYQVTDTGNQSSGFGTYTLPAASSSNTVEFYLASADPAKNLAYADNSLNGGCITNNQGLAPHTNYRAGAMMYQVFRP